MIQFICKCGHVFVVDDDCAGSSEQCPDCGLLCDVPLHADLAALAEDGTFKLDQELGPQPQRLERLAYVYQKRRVDEGGNEIDLRDMDRDLDPVVEDTPIDPAAVPRVRAPRYDPETGELIRPMDVNENVPPAPPVVPPFAGPVSGYKRPPAAFEPARELWPAELPAELWRPGNAVVMGIVLGAHLLLVLALFTVLSGIFIVLLAPAILLFLIIAHYGNVIDETGPKELDELPRPLRQVEWHDDLWGPFSHVCFAAMLAFFPIIAMLVIRRFIELPAAITIAVTSIATPLGCLAFPAIVFTTTTSGSAANLRPDRLLGVVRQCGATYLILVAEFIVAVAGHVAGVAGMVAALQGALYDMHSFGPLGTFPGSFACLLAGIYAGHLFTWHLGVIYRIHHRHLPWIYHRLDEEDAAGTEPAPPPSPGGPHRPAVGPP